jgi:hypothetical protein
MEGSQLLEALLDVVPKHVGARLGAANQVPGDELMDQGGDLIKPPLGSQVSSPIITISLRSRAAAHPAMPLRHRPNPCPDGPGKGVTCRGHRHRRTNPVTRKGAESSNRRLDWLAAQLVA